MSGVWHLPQGALTHGAANWARGTAGTSTDGRTAESSQYLGSCWHDPAAGGQACQCRPARRRRPVGTLDRRAASYQPANRSPMAPAVRSGWPRNSLAWCAWTGEKAVNRCRCGIARSHAR